MKPKIKLAIVGSRSFNDLEAFNKYMALLNDWFEIIQIISGGAKGADTFGEEYAIVNNIPAMIFRADWKKYGKKAGYIRNVDIIKNCDVCIAFWDGRSKGTEHDLELCETYSKPCYIYNSTDESFHKQ